MKKLLTGLSIALGGVALAAPASAFTLGEHIHKAENWLRCEEMAPAERAVCKVVSDEVNGRLNAAGIRLDHGNVVYTTSGFANVNQKSGCKSLSTRASHLALTLNTHVPLRFEGNLIEAPFVASLTLPAHVNGEIRVRERSRTRYPGGKCADPTTSDDWSAVLDADVTALAKLIISLEPKFSVLQNGDYEVVLDPFVAVETAVADVDLKPRIRGRDHAWFSVHDAWNFFVGIDTGLHINTPLFLTGLMSKDEYLRQWRGIGVDGGSAIVSSLLVLDNAVLGQAIQAKAARSAETEAERRAREEARALETRLNGQIQRALGANGVGQVRFVIPARALPPLTPPPGVAFLKHGDNGTASCATYCEGPQWGEVGICRGAVRGDTGERVACGLMPGFLNGHELTCECARPFAKPGNNGTVSCDTFCGGTQWPGGTGRCVAATRTDRGESLACDAVPGLLSSGQLLCQCAGAAP